MVKNNTLEKKITDYANKSNDIIEKSKKVSKGRFQKVCHSYCLKSGDLILIKYGKKINTIREVKTLQIVNGKYKILLAYDGKDVKNASVSISSEEYQNLKNNGDCSKIKIVRTRRGMIWRKHDRLKYELEHQDQYRKKTNDKTTA